MYTPRQLSIFSPGTGTIEMHLGYLHDLVHSAYIHTRETRIYFDPFVCAVCIGQRGGGTEFDYSAGPILYTFFFPEYIPEFNFLSCDI